MRALIRIGWLGLGALVLLLCAASPALAAWGPIKLLSAGPAQQAERAETPVVSADGRYVAFKGTIGPLTGIFREDLASGVIEPVVAGNAEEFGLPTRSELPSISADGRYVAFMTPAQLDPGDDPQGSSTDVYVADLSGPAPTYELASALDGCDPAAPDPHAPCGLTYEVPSSGSKVSARVALSGDGRRVAFFTESASDLTSGPGGSTEGVPTPAGQIVLRDLDRDTTELVSVERDPASGAPTGLPVPGGSIVASSSRARLRGAALSADGSTVAWLGTHLPAQVPLQPAEAAKFAELDASDFPYDEPLWRRVGDGAAAPIRRVVAGDGTLYPFPQLTGKSRQDLNSTEGWLGANVIGVPRLSADGRTVVLIGNPTEATNVFSVDMSPGLTRAEAVRQLTREIAVNPAQPEIGVNEERFLPINGHVWDVAVDATGRRIALLTARQRFPLSPPNLVGSPPSSLGLVEVYVIDLQAETVERVTHGIGGPGEPSLGSTTLRATVGEGSSSPSFGEGGKLVFASLASNLVEGDGNGASDVFLARSTGSPPGTGVVELPPGPEPITGKSPWRLRLSAFSRPDGSVRLVAVVPAAGRLHAGVGAELGSRKRPRKLAKEQANARSGGPVAIELRLPNRFRSLTRSGRGVYATVEVSFRHKGRKTLRGRVQVRFRSHAAKPERGR